MESLPRLPQYKMRRTGKLQYRKPLPLLAKNNDKEMQYDRQTQYNETGSSKPQSFKMKSLPRLPQYKMRRTGKLQYRKYKKTVYSHDILPVAFTCCGAIHRLVNLQPLVFGYLILMGFESYAAGYKLMDGPQLSLNYCFVSTPNLTALIEQK